MSELAFSLNPDRENAHTWNTLLLSLIFLYFSSVGFLQMFSMYLCPHIEFQLNIIQQRWDTIVQSLNEIVLTC